MTLYAAVMSNRMCTFRLAHAVMVLCGAHGLKYDGSGEFPPDEDGTGLYVIVDGRTLGWLPFEAIIPPYPWA